MTDYNEAAQPNEYAAEHDKYYERAVTFIGSDLPTIAEELGSGAPLSAPMTVSEATVQGTEQDQTHGHIMEEEAVLTEFMHFLDQVRTIAIDDHSDEGREVVALAERFSRSSSFLSSERMQEAIDGLAAYYRSFLESDPRARVFLNVPTRFMKGKSQGLIARALSRSKALSKDPTIARRFTITDLSDASESAVLDAFADLSPEQVKIVNGDDWVSSGEQIREMAEVDLHTLHRFGLDRFGPSVEVNLIVARDDQSDGRSESYMPLIMLEDARRLSKRIPVVAYFRAQGVEHPYRGPVPTGAHSVTDRGFMNQVGRMAQYLSARTGADVTYPHIATIRKADLGVRIDANIY